MQRCSETETYGPQRQHGREHRKDEHQSGQELQEATVQPSTPRIGRDQESHVHAQCNNGVTRPTGDDPEHWNDEWHEGDGGSDLRGCRFQVGTTLLKAEMIHSEEVMRQHGTTRATPSSSQNWSGKLVNSTWTISRN